ncbi:MAG: AI-2E family transporter [Gammaproteobacteria bacterium]|nr:AI-2E family transporter [Gammaproteobacteria bacterium]|tara:strand:- start:77 stop:1120 length:1044 start_codon:yes stop_codon:yes gene_type:complete
MQNLFEKFLNRFFSNEESIYFAILLLLSFIFILFFGSILFPVIVSIIIAFLLNGLLKTLVGINLSYKLSLSITLLVFFGFYLSLFLALPSIGTQINNLLQNLPIIVETFQTTLSEMNDYFSEEDLEIIFANLSNQINTLLGSALGQLAGTISLMFNAILYAIMIPLMVFFFLKDKNQLIPLAAVLLPKENGFMQSVFSEMNDQLFNYVTGKFLEMIIVTTVSYGLFAVLDLPYAVLIAILVGLSVIIPIFGAILVTIPVVLIGLYEWGLSANFYWLIGMYLIIQMLDGNVLVPILFSNRNNLHPVIIIVAILFFGGLWGFWGLFFAIPLATFIKAIINSWPDPKNTL